MTAHPLTIAAIRRQTQPQNDRYIVEFRLETKDGCTAWFLPQEEHMPETPADVFAVIAEHYPGASNREVTFADGLGLMRITKLCADTGQYIDVTADMSRAYARWLTADGWEWPLWAGHDDREFEG